MTAVPTPSDSSIEALESRIAPAAAFSSSSYLFAKAAHDPALNAYIHALAKVSHYAPALPPKLISGGASSTYSGSSSTMAVGFFSAGASVEVHYGTFAGSTGSLSASSSLSMAGGTLDVTGALEKSGAGTLTGGGSGDGGTATYGGTLTLNSGSLLTSGTGTVAVGNLAEGGTLVLGNTGVTNATLNLSGGSATFVAPASITDATLLQTINLSGSNTLVLSNPIALPGTLPSISGGTDASTGFVVSNGSLVLSGGTLSGATLTLAGASYSGGVIINGGTGTGTLPLTLTSSIGSVAQAITAGTLVVTSPSGLVAPTDPPADGE
jgi:hypothetical protein